MNSRISVVLLAAALFAACTGAERAPPERDAREAPVDRQPTMVTSWVIETVEPMNIADVAEIVGAVIEEPSAEPLFPETRAFENMYIVTSEEPRTEPEAFDVKYQLEDLPQVTDAAPNFSDHEPELPREAAAACLIDSSDDVPVQHDWSLDAMNVRTGWVLEPEAGGARFGEGVAVCHPDSGWAEHVEFDSDAIVKDQAIDLIDGGSGEDPLDYAGNPGHGTATGSVIVSGDNSGGGSDARLVTGIAPRARVIPIRTLTSVALFLDSDVARAVDYARTQSCDVVSMSLGGAGFFGLKKIVRKAVEENEKIVVTAAGNCVGAVVAPAKYETTIAVAASNWDDEPWKGSSRGSAVTVTAPGEGIWVARRERDSTDTTKVEPSNGTSYATAAVAGAAADWIAFHGRERLQAAKGEHSLAALFRFALGQAVRTPTDWDSTRYGPGILDLKALLEVDLGAFPRDQPRFAPDDSALANLARSIDRTPQQTRDVLRFLFDGNDVEALAATYGPELERMAATRPEDMQRILDLVDQRAERTAIDGEIAGRLSSRLRAATGH